MKAGNRQKGYALVEILAVVAIEAMLLAVLAGLLIQTFTVSRRSNTEIAALENVKTAAYWIVRDVKKAATTTLASGSSASTLVLDWTVWYDSGGNLITNGQPHHCVYALAGTKLQRTYDYGSVQTVARFISNVQFSRLTGSQADIIVLSITSSPERNPQTAQQMAYHMYLKPKVSPLR